MTDAFKGLYAIADIGVLAARGMRLREFAEGLQAAGVQAVQLRDKGGSPQEVLEAAKVLRESFDGLLIMNDRLDLAVMARFDGVHVGQDDLAVGDVRAVDKGLIAGVSTHTDEQVRAAEMTDADYVAIGPVFATGTKADAAAVVGIEGVRMARSLTSKPLVAIGGITRANAASVVKAGADAVAVISGLLVEGESVEKVARDFLRVFR